MAVPENQISKRAGANVSGGECAAVPSLLRPDCEARRTILHVAKQRFLHYGYKKTTIDEIAQDAGVGKGSVYLYFSSKEQILLTLAQEINQNVTSELRCIAASFATPEEKLRRIVLARITAMYDILTAAAHGVEIMNEVERPEIKACILEEKAEQTRVVAAVLREGVTRGDFTLIDNDADVAAKHLMMAFVSFAPPFVRQCHGELHCILSLKARATAMLEFVLHGLRRRSENGAASE